MEDLKIGLINLGAVTFAVLADFNTFLTSIVLLSSLVYTIIRIKKILKK
jgi:hypothetical protein